MFDCEPTVPGVTCDVDVLRQVAADNTAAAEIVEVTIDGVRLKDIRNYRAASPEPFAITFPEGRCLGFRPARTFHTSPTVTG